MGWGSGASWDRLGAVIPNLGHSLAHLGILQYPGRPVCTSDQLHQVQLLVFFYGFPGDSSMQPGLRTSPLKECFLVPVSILYGFHLSTALPQKDCWQDAALEGSGEFSHSPSEERESQGHHICLVCCVQTSSMSLHNSKGHLFTPYFMWWAPQEIKLSVNGDPWSWATG